MWRPKEWWDTIERQAQEQAELEARLGLQDQTKRNERWEREGFND